MQRPALTVQGLDNVADDLWLEQLQNMNLEFISDLQQMRSLDGFYSIDVLCKGAEDCRYTLEQLDGSILKSQGNTITARSLLQSPTNALIIAHVEENHYSTVVSHSGSLVHLNSLKRKPTFISERWLDQKIQSIKSSESNLSVFRLVHSWTSEQQYASQDPVAVIQVPSTSAVVYVTPSKVNVTIIYT